MMIKTVNYASIKEITDSKVNSFAIADLIGVMEHLEMHDIPVMQIGSIFVEKENRNKGRGTALLKETVESHPDAVIMVVAGASMDEYKEEPTFEEIQEVLKTLDRFYTRAGFVSVNEKIAGYENMHVYIYDNKNGHTVIDYCMRSIEAFKNAMNVAN